MDTAKERRSIERIASETSVLSINYASKTFHGGKILNCSNTGILFESEFHFEPGSFISIKPEIHIESADIPSIQDMYYAKVIWIVEKKTV